MHTLPANRCHSTTSRLLVCVAITLVALFILSACDQSSSSAPTKKRTSGKRAHLVELATVTRTTLSQARTYTGSLRARRVVRVHALEEGRIIRLPYFEGDAVKRGDQILQLDQKLLNTELAKATAMRKEAQANLQRLQRLGKQRLISKDELLRARTIVDVTKAEEILLQTRISYTHVAAPFAGIITERLAEPGDILKRHDHVLTLADPSSMIADLMVSEMLMPHLQTGQAAQVRIDALGDQIFPGTVQRIHPNLDPATRQGRVEVKLTSPPAGVRSGQFARVEFQIRALNRSVIPFSAVRRDAEGEYVFRLDDNKKAQRVRIRAGQRLADRVEILEGLNDGDRIVTKGFLGLESGKSVKPVGDRKQNQAKS
jgi:RND family efflux transporter MFP subunit